MFKITSQSALIFFIILFTSVTMYAQLSSFSIIPKPYKINAKDGTFVLNKKVGIAFNTGNPGVEGIVNYFQNKIEEITALSLKTKSKKNNIIFNLKKAEIPGNEGYELVITKNNVTITGHDLAGLFYGVQTFLQLIPAEKYCKKSKSIHLPCVEISDHPRFQWRGMMLDVSRHFIPKEFIYDFIDYLAMHKLNTFHWHLCDDQGWRIEIKKYPKLTEVGAWRVDRLDKPWNAREQQKEGETPTYGGFYTQDEIRDIVTYAQSRYVTIIPEIEMPGHTMAALAAYPQFSCEGGPYHVLTGGYWPISDIYCAGNDSTFEFLQNVLSEVIDLFPSTYIHIGGDEAEKSKWKTCKKCQARIRNEGLADEHELQSYFIKRIEKFINSQGRKLIGWDEILEGGLAPSATVMSWRGFEGGIAAAKSGHDVIMTPTSHCYFDYYQGDPDQEPLAGGGFLPIKKVYSFEPIPEDLTKEETKHVLGGQANVWTEYMLHPDHVRYMIFPRIAALAEVVWTSENNRNWNDFSRRLYVQLKRYKNMGIKYAQSVYNIQAFTAFDLTTKEFSVKLETELIGPDIFYTVDGSEPTLHSKRYTKPIVFNQSTQLKAQFFSDGLPAGNVFREKLKLHKATGKNTYPNAAKYDGGGAYGLTDGLQGSTNLNDGRWKGFEQVDLEAVVDLEKITSINKITVGFLNLINSWIFLPQYVEYAVSNDGNDFQIITRVENDLPTDHGEKTVKEFSVSFDEIQVRYIRVFAKNIVLCPDWHQGAGGKAWLFVDDITVE